MFFVKTKEEETQQNIDISSQTHNIVSITNQITKLIVNHESRINFSKNDTNW